MAHVVEFVRKQRWPFVIALIIPFLFTVSFQGCGGKSETPAQKISSAPVAQVHFERLKGSPNGRSFKVIVKQEAITPASITHATLSKGTLSTWTQVDASTIEATVTPSASNPTGKYKINLTTSDGQSFERTPVVLKTVNNRWNQPESFASPVNTVGWEDSPSTFVVRDANGNETLYLALVYIPVRFNCAKHPTDPNLSGSVNNPYCEKVRGPIAGPQRPNVTLAAYVASDGTIDQRLPTLMSPTFVGAAKLGATLYVFKIGTDGHPGFLGTPAATPQALYIEGDDGYSTEAGPFIFNYGANYNLMYHFDKLIDTQLPGGPLCPGYASDTGVDAYILGNYDFNASAISLGHYDRVDPGETFSNGSTNTGTYPCPELIWNNHIQNGIETTSMQDNPTVYFPTSGQPVVIWDLEGTSAGFLQMQQLNAGGVFPTGPWTTVNHAALPVLAAPPMNGGSQPEKTQPVLTDTEMCMRIETEIYCTPYNGGDPTLAASYGASVLQMAGDPDAVQLGQIYAVGEPSLFTYQNQDCMSFIFAEHIADADGNKDLDVGWVCE